MREQRVPSCIGRSAERLDRFELLGERAEAGALDRSFVHEAAVEVAVAAGVGVAARACGVFDQDAQLHLRPVAQLPERADARLIGRDAGLLQPGAR